LSDSTQQATHVYAPLSKILNISAGAYPLQVSASIVVKVRGPPWFSNIGWAPRPDLPASCPMQYTTLPYLHYADVHFLLYAPGDPMWPGDGMTFDPPDKRDTTYTGLTARIDGIDKESVILRRTNL
jgi:hypothetical protein